MITHYPHYPGRYAAKARGNRRFTAVTHPAFTVAGPHKNRPGVHGLRSDATGEKQDYNNQQN